MLNKDILCILLIHTNFINNTLSLITKANTIHKIKTILKNQVIATSIKDHMDGEGMRGMEEEGEDGDMIEEGDEDGEEEEEEEGKWEWEWEDGE